MSRHDKLIKRLLTKPNDFEWSEAVTLLGHFDFEVLTNSGSRRKFYNKSTKQVIILHEPHPGNILKAYAVKQLTDTLKEGGFI